MRKILHIDLDAFFCSVEELLDPALRGIPFATGGTADGRGVVTSCSYAARLKGVHSAMPISQALRLCTGLKTIRGNHQRYSEYSRKVMAVFEQVTPLVQPISIDEAFLDVTDLPQSSREIALQIQRSVKQETGLPCSIGAASNKLVAKIATNVGKAGHQEPTPPMAIFVISPGGEKAFLKPLPVREMWGIGPKSARYLQQNGVHTIGDMQNMSVCELQRLVGSFAPTLRRRALGIDDRPVGDDSAIKSVSNERTFFDYIVEKEPLLSVVRALAQKVARRLRTKGLAGRTVRVKLRWADYNTIIRQTTLDQPTNHDSVIFGQAKDLVLANWKAGKKVRLVGVGVSKLESGVHQLSLFDRQFEKEHQLLKTIDALHARYGKDIIQRGGKRE